MPHSQLKQFGQNGYNKATHFSMNSGVSTMEAATPHRRVMSSTQWVRMMESRRK